MRYARTVWGLWLYIGLLCYGVAVPAAASGDTLIIGTKEAPPFAMKDADGRWHGISIELWQTIATALELDYRLQERDLQGLLEGLRDGSLDASVAALTITPEREAQLDFSHPYYTTGLGIAVAAKPTSQWLGLLRGLLSWHFLKVIASLTALLLLIGGLVWWREHRRNPAQFPADPLRGIGAGLWWAAVTMTTVGYGDKAPTTLGGRLIGLVWMFASIIMISGFTAAITTSLTVNQLSVSISGPDDLPSVRTAAVQGTTGAAYLQQQQLNYLPVATVQAGLQALTSGTRDALVHDAPLLRYWVNAHYPGQLQVLPSTFVRQDYAIALPTASPLREPLNRQLLTAIQQPHWQRILTRYLGQQP